MRSSKYDMKHVSNLIIHQNSHKNDYNDHIAKQMIVRTSIRIYACLTHKHNAMRAIKHRTQNTIKHWENKHKVKQGFLIKECLLPLWISPPKNMHMSHKIFSPFLSQIVKWIKRKEGKKMKLKRKTKTS